MATFDGVDAMYMDNLDEFINDENKIVTYRWLSTTLQVHVNQAKQMLYNFVMQQRNGNKEDNLNVTYFVAGLQKNEDSTKIHHCEVVSESLLDAVKSTLQKLYSCHIYSIQKSKLQESDALYITDYNLMKENVFESCKQSSIHFDAAKRVASSESVVSEIKKEVITPSALLNNDTHPKKLESTEKTTAVSKKHGGKSNKMSNIAGMFAKASAKKESPKNNGQNQNSPNIETKPTVKKESTVPKKPTGVMSFFANSAAKTKPSEEKAPIIKKEPPVVSEKKKKKKRTEHKKKPASSDSDDDIVHQKKRRRIKDDLFDSSSSEEEMETEDPLPSPVTATPDSEEEKKEEEEKEDEKKEDEEESIEENEAPIPDTPEQKKVKKEEPATVLVTSDGRRRKHIKRKKKKTYLNDEGFMVTETVMVSDSTDASDMEHPPNEDSNPSKPSVQKKKISPAAAAAKAIADKGKQKQSSLMSFFQKK